MLYFIKHGDTLYTICKDFSITMNEIRNANVICNTEYVLPGQPLIIPKQDIGLPKAGATPYYIVQPGDTLASITREFSTANEVLLAANNIKNEDMVFFNSELLIIQEIPDGKKLYQLWDDIGLRYGNLLNPIQIHAIYYTGSFLWEALGEEALKHLFVLLRHPCEIVRYFSAVSLGRIAVGKNLENELKEALNDRFLFVSEAAKIALKRINLVDRGLKRVHITTVNNTLFETADMGSKSIPIKNDTEVVVLRWFIPSPLGENRFPGIFQIYDYIQVLNTGKTGFIPRYGNNEITMI